MGELKPREFNLLKVKQMLVGPGFESKQLHTSELIGSVQFSSVAQSCLTLCNPMDCSTPGLPVHHQLQSLLKPMSIALVMPSNHLILCGPLLLPPSIILSIGLFKWISSSNQVAKVLEFQLQHQSFQWIFRTDFLSDGLLGSPCSPRNSQESSPTPQFKSINSLALSFLYSPALTSIHDYWKKTYL